MSEFGRRTLNIGNTRGPKSDTVSEILEVQFRTPNLQYYRSEFGHRIANTRCSSSDTESPDAEIEILEIRVWTPNLKYWTSEFGRRIFDTRGPSSGAESSILEVRVRTPNLKY